MIKRMWIVAHVDVGVDDNGNETQVTSPFVLCRTFQQDVAERALGHFVSAEDGNKTIVRSTLQLLSAEINNVVYSENSLIDDVISATVDRNKTQG